MADIEKGNPKRITFGHSNIASHISKNYVKNYEPYNCENVRFLWQQKITLTTLSQNQIKTIDTEQIFNRYVHANISETYFLLSLKSFNYVIKNSTRVHSALSYTLKSMRALINQSLSGNMFNMY